MYARVTFAQIQPEKTDELTQFIRDNVLPAARQSHGFRGLQIMIDRAAGKGIAIAMWETEADMAASEASGGYYREQLARGAHFFTAPPVWEAYEVTIHE
jgi:heme-degrading monooxygenase HmoA